MYERRCISLNLSSTLQCMKKWTVEMKRLMKKLCTTVVCVSMYLGLSCYSFVLEIALLSKHGGYCRVARPQTKCSLYRGMFCMG